MKSLLHLASRQSSVRIRSSCVALLLLGQTCLVLPPNLEAQVLTWDATPGTPGLQNGSGTWNTTVANWLDSTSANVLWGNTGLETAQFGSTTPVAANTVTIAGNMNLKGMNFLALGTATPVAGQQYALNGAAANTVLNFGDGGLIQFADFSSGGSQFVSFGANLALQGSNLTLQKSSGTATQFVNLNMLSNPNLTGMLTIGSYIYAGIGAQGTVANVSGITIRNNGTLTLGGTGNYTMPITASGFANTYAAIRVTGNGVTLSGGITMTGSTGVLMHSGNTGMVISAPITDGGAGYAFHRFTLTKSDGTVTLNAANTYGGNTVLGRNTSGYTGGITVLDYAAAAAPQQDILYNGLASPGGLDLLGSNIGSSVLMLTGKAGVTNSQRLGNISVQGFRSSIELTSGAGGEMNLSFDSLGRTTTGTIAFTAPASGSITTSMADTVLGPWATYKSGSGLGTWAQVSGGVLTNFSGSTPAVTSTPVTSDATSHLMLNSGSSGPVTQTGSLAHLATVSMVDTQADRTLLTGAGNTLRLGGVGGVQITSNAKSLTIGQLGVASSLSAGGASAGTGQLFLTNHSNSSLLTVHSGITNNAGGGAVTLLINGSAGSTTILTGTSSHTGGTVVASGALELRNGAALGSTGGTINVIEGGSLRFSNGITFIRPLTLSGLGASTAVDGVLRNVSGNNTLTGLMTLVGNSTFTSDAGLLTIQAATPATNAIAGTVNLNVGGRGDMVINGRIGIGTGLLTKTGNGSLTLGGDNNFTGILTINAGVLRPTHANALGVSGSTFGSTTINAGAAMELAGGITLAAEPITISSLGINNTGGIRNVSGNNTLTGLITLGGVTIRIQSDSGKLIFDTASGAAITQTATTARVLVLSGAGAIDVLDPITRTSTGALTLTKEGNGTATMATSVSNTITTVNGGALHLDFSAASSPATNILHSGIATPNELNMNSGTLLITGKSGASNSQAFGPVVPTGVNTAFGGSSYIQVNQNGATRVDISFGSFTRGVAGILGITRPTTGSLTTTGGADNSIFLSAMGTPYLWSLDATAGDEWLGSTAIAGGVRQIVPLSSLSSGGYTPSTASGLTGNANIASGVGTTTLTAASTITSLRFGQAQETTITQDATARTLTVGGILVSSTVGNFTQTISTAILKAPEAGVANDLPIIQNNTAAPLVITSAIPNITGFSTGVTKGGAGTLVLKGASSYTGSTRVHEGILHFQGGSISPNTEFLLGSGDKSGKIILGVGSTAYNTVVDWLQVMGTGTDNRIVGGASAISTLMVDNVTSNNNFRAGFLGGPGTNENNLSLSVNDVATLSTATTPTTMFLPLGPANTYAGQTLIRNATVEASVLANKGSPSSLGTGSSNEVIEMASGGNSTVLHIFGGLRYVGSADASTDRPLQLANSVSTVLSMVAAVENNGTGTLKFTAPFTSTGTNVTAPRTLRLTGTNTGANEIVSMGNNGTVATALQKIGPGTWTITGDSPHGGGTTVSGGLLLVTNLTGSGTGTGSVTVSAGASLGGTGRIVPAADQSVTISGGTLQIGADLPGILPVAGALTIHTSGSGLLSLQTGSVLAFDLFAGAGLGNNTGISTAADLAIILGSVSFASGTTLRVSNPNGMGTWAANDQWKIFDWSGLTGTVTGSVDQFDLPTLPDGLMWNTTDLFSSGILSISLVPEPSRALFILFGGLGLISRRRRQF